MRTLLGRTTSWAISGLCMLALAGCGDVEGDNGRNVVRVVSVNDNQPVFADVVMVNEADTTTSVRDDVVQIQIQARPHDGILTIDPDGPFGSVTFRSYRVDYFPEDLDGDSVPDLQSFTGNTNVTVVSGGTATVGVVVLTISEKLQAPLVCLGPLGSGDPSCSGVTDAQYSVFVQITLFGIEETSGDEIEATGNVALQIANFADDD